MTNPIAKAIAKVGVAMGYGRLEDYKGSSVEDMLESFASIAQEKGGSGSVGGGAVYATFTENEGTWACDKTYTELKTAYDSGCVIIGKIGGENVPFIFQGPFLLINYDGEKWTEFSGSYTRYHTGTNSLFYCKASIQEAGNTVFAEYGSIAINA